jgi:hypothetical protein
MKREKAGTDWNSVRHYAQKHQHEAHFGPAKFSTTVSDAFRRAKADFAQGAFVAHVDSDGATPGITLTRKD